MNQYVFEEERPVVDTKCGKIRGIAYGGVNIFMGIDRNRWRWRKPIVHTRRRWGRCRHTGAVCNSWPIERSRLRV